MRRNEGIRKGIGLAGALLFAVVGCDGTGSGGGDPSAGSASPAVAGATDDTVQSEALQDEAMGLRAKIEFPDQGVVKFFEPQDGVVLIAEVGKNGTPPMIPASMEGMPATDLYQALAKQTAPSALVEAVSRAALLKQRTPLANAVPLADLAPPSLRAAETARASADSGLTQVSSALTFSNSYDQWFYDNFCAGGKYVGNGWDYVVQWMYVTGTGSFQRNDMNWVDSTVSVYGGGAVHYRVQIRPWYSWSTTADVQIQNGYYNKWHRDNGTDYDVYIYVDQASGDSYHLCSYGDSW